MAFEKGKSGNPAGRPKGAIDIRAEIAMMFAEKKIQKLEELLDAMIEKSIKKKNVPAAKVVFEYLMAKPKNDIGIVMNDIPESVLTLPHSHVKVIMALEGQNLSEEKANKVVSIIKGEKTTEN